MAIIYSQNIIEIALKHTYAGRPSVNVLHVYNDEGGGSDASKARDVLNNWQDHIVPLSDAGYVLQEATWRSLDQDDTNQGTLVPDPAKPTTGTGGGDGMPPNVAFLVKKQTANRQRGQRDGRIFLGGVPRSLVFENGSLTPSFVTSANTALAAFLDGVNDSPGGSANPSYLAVLNTTPASRVKGTQVVTLTSREVIGLNLDPMVSTQRDRLR